MAGERRNESPMPNFWVPDYAAATNILSKPLLGRAGDKSVDRHVVGDDVIDRHVMGDHMVHSHVLQGDDRGTSMSWNTNWASPPRRAPTTSAAPTAPAAMGFHTEWKNIARRRP